MHKSDAEIWKYAAKYKDSYPVVQDLMEMVIASNGQEHQQRVFRESLRHFIEDLLEDEEGVES